jgi:hypothetical protein
MDPRISKVARNNNLYYCESQIKENTVRNAKQMKEKVKAGRIFHMQITPEDMQIR